MKAHRIGVLATLIAGLAIAAPSPAAAGVEGAFCDYDAALHKVVITVYGDVSTQVWRDTAGKIQVNGFWCDAAATVTNTDSIVVAGDFGHQGLELLLLHGGFKPGAWDEPGKTDEIEFTIDLAGGADSILITGTNANQKIDLGQYDTLNGTLRTINLNGAETKGIDTDMIMANVEWVTIDAKGGNDVIRAQGNPNLFLSPFALPLYVYGGNGNDKIKGGATDDHLYGGLGVDEIWGNGGNDYIDLFDGVAGDIGHGGDGTDTCQHDLTDTCDI